MCTIFTILTEPCVRADIADSPPQSRSTQLSQHPPIASTSQLPPSSSYQLPVLPAPASSPSFGQPSPDAAASSDGRLATTANPLALFAEVAEDHQAEGGTSTYPSPHNEAEQVVELLQGNLDPTLAHLNLNLNLCKSSLLTVMVPQLFKGEKKVAMNRSHELAVRDLSAVRLVSQGATTAKLIY